MRFLSEYLKDFRNISNKAICTRTIFTMKKILGSYQVPKMERRLLYHSGVKTVIGMPSESEGFVKVTGISVTANVKRKVVGVGLGKTGTTSLAHCLTYLGYNHQWYDADLFLDYPHSTDNILDVLKHKDSCEDFPWPYLYKEIDELYPDSKFILTMRENPEIWYRSLCKHFARGGKNTQKLLAYGHNSPLEDKQAHIDLYLRHSEAIQCYFAARPEKLLVVCWGQGDGWGEICKFLGHSVPPVPFPHANKAPN